MLPVEHEAHLGGHHFSVRFAHWLDDKHAAVATTWDDFCIGSWQQLASRAFNMGAPMTYFVNSCGWCMCGKYTAHVDPSTAPSIADVLFLRRAVSDGHEVGSHSAHHHDMTHVNATDVASDAHEWLHEMEERHRIVQSADGITMALPAGLLPKSEDAQRALSQYFIGVRTATAGNNPSNTNASGVHHLRAWLLHSSVRAADLRSHVDRAIAQREFMVTFGHGLSGLRPENGTGNATGAVDRDREGWRPVPAATVAEHLGYLAARQDVLWRATFGSVVRYILARSLVRPQVLAVQHAQGQRELHVDFAERTRLKQLPFAPRDRNLPMTLLVRTPREAPLLACTQGANSCELRLGRSHDAGDEEAHPHRNETSTWVVSTAGVDLPVRCTLGVCGQGCDRRSGDHAR